MQVGGWERHKLWQPRRAPGVFSRVSPIVQSLSLTMGLIIQGKKIDLGAWRQSKEAYCYLWENIPTCELWIYLKLKLEPGFQHQDWLLSVLSILWWAAVQSSLAFLHGWSPNSHGITSSAWLTASETAPLCPKWLELTCQHGLTFGLNKF